ncbi:hypothetical protein SAMN05428949_6590 [Chitinophaga sp. YR627]|uniref:hypothetical protein n=1 Tax=Chitinophaga sp. YR627 TaxID=1881041 RepID=UPI0008E82743|nr:hypothetical protein [Chitinophaga sp. YR627]SFO77544.1 hypothetical protein SAMN05428949_6590 [Chitinophaga sp. YR627]
MKKIFFLLLTIAFFTACQKRGDLPELPSYATFRLSSSSVEHFYEVTVGDSVLEDSLSAGSALSRYVVTGKQALKIKEAGKKDYVIDTLIDIDRPGVEYTLIDLGGDSRPLILSGSDLATTAPAEGTRKYALLNIDTTGVLKGRTIDIRFYDIDVNDGSFKQIGELKGIQYLNPSDYIELKAPDAGIFFLEVADHTTGEIILPVDSYAGNMIFPFDENNVYLMKLLNAGDESFTFISAEPLIGLKL